MLCTETELDPVLTHNTGSKLIISAAHIAFGRQHNPITSILFLTKTIHGCETESVSLCVHGYTHIHFCCISWCRYYYTDMNPTKCHASTLGCKIVLGSSACFDNLILSGATVNIILSNTDFRKIYK